MIIEWALQLWTLCVEAFFLCLDILPDLPVDIINVIDTFFEFMFNSVSLVHIFIDLGMVKTLIPFVLVIINFDRILTLTIFIIKKIPFVGME